MTALLANAMLETAKPRKMVWPQVLIQAVLAVLLAAPLAAKGEPAGPGRSEPLAKAPKNHSSSSILPGSNSRQPVNIQAESLDYFDKEQKLVYTGNVVAVQGDSKLKCSVLTIYLPPKTAAQSGAQAGANQVQHMEAAGPVTMVSKDQIGTGEHGTYDKVSDTVVLTGNVTLSQGPNVTKGDRLVYNLKSGQAKVTGSHVISMFQPSDSSAAEPKN